MANETKATNTELESVALKIYVERVSGMRFNRATEQLAIQSFKEAESFLAVRDMIRDGELDTNKPTAYASA